MPFYYNKPTTEIPGTYAPNEREMPPVLVQFLDELGSEHVDPRLAKDAAEIVLDFFQLDAQRATEELLLGIDLHPQGAQVFIESLEASPLLLASIFEHLSPIEGTRFIRTLDRVDPILSERLLEILKKEHPFKAMEISAALLDGAGGYYQGREETGAFKSRDGISLNPGFVRPSTYKLAF